MKGFITAILLHLYQWSLSFSRSPKQAAIKAVYFFAALFFFNLMSISSLLEYGSRNLFICFLMVSLLLMVFLYKQFVQKERYAASQKAALPKKYLGVTAKRFTQLYVVLTIVLFMASLYHAYLFNQKVHYRKLSASFQQAVYQSCRL